MIHKLRFLNFSGPLVIIGALALSALVGRFAAQAGQAGFVSVLLPLMALAAGATALIILANWRLGLVLFLLWIIFEDFARKFLGNNMVVYFGKDVLVGIAYLSFLLRAKHGEELLFRPPFIAPLVVFGVLATLQAVNFNSPSLWYGAVGLKLYLYYIPLMFLGYALFPSERQLTRFFTVMLLVAMVVSGLGIAQAIIGHDFLNPKELAPELILARLTRESPITGIVSVRPAGIFVSVGRYNSYQLFMFIVSIGILLYSLLRHRGILLSGLTLSVISAGILLSNSRAALVYSALALVVGIVNLWWSSRAELRQGITALGGVRQMVLPLMLGIVGALFFFPDAVFARWAYFSETFSPWSATSELRWRVVDYGWDNFVAVFSNPWWVTGYGTGVNSLGGQYVVNLLGAAPVGVGVESGWGSLILEMGILGPFAWYAWALTLVWYEWQIVRKLRGTALQPLAFSIWWFTCFITVISSYGGVIAYQEFITNAHLWLLVGILFRLPDFVREQQPVGIPEGHHSRAAIS